MNSGSAPWRHRVELVVVRHGRTAWNADGRFQGHTDVPLDDAGREQARALAGVLRGERFEAAVASDLSRARETAERIVAGTGVALRTDERWREMRFGAWEGLTWAEILAREPAMSGRSIAEPGGYVASGGETFAAVCKRVASALAELDASARDGARILIVTHAGTLHALLRVTLGEAAATQLRVRFSPASVTRIAVDAAGARILELNGTAEPPAAGNDAKPG